MDGSRKMGRALMLVAAFCSAGLAWTAPSAAQPAGPSAAQPAGPSAAQPAGPSAAQPAGPDQIRPEQAREETASSIIAGLRETETRYRHRRATVRRLEQLAAARGDAGRLDQLADLAYRIELVHARALERARTRLGPERFARLWPELERGRVSPERLAAMLGGPGKAATGGRTGTRGPATARPAPGPDGAEPRPDVRRPAGDPQPAPGPERPGTRPGRKPAGEPGPPPGPDGGPAGGEGRRPAGEPRPAPGPEDPETQPGRRPAGEPKPAPGPNADPKADPDKDT